MNNYYKSKSFLAPIVSLVIVVTVIITSINAYLSIDMFKQHMQEHIDTKKKEYIEKHKHEIYRKVHLVNKSIEFQITKIEKKVQSSLKDRVKTALNIMHLIYNKYKDTKSKEEIKSIIHEYLKAIRFNNNRGYYFGYDNKTKVLFTHVMKKFIGKDMTNFTDIRGQNLMNLDHEILKKNKIGYSTIYFNKPNQQNKEFPKITCISRFEPLDLVIGTGEYLDVTEKSIKKYVLDRFNNFKNEKNKYLFFLKLHNIEGGKNFATVLLNSNRPNLAGTRIDDDHKDFKGEEFRKEYLKILKNKGEGYIKYRYEKPISKEIKLKISYFYLQKDWNWIIGCGFYFDDLEKQISNKEKSLSEYTNHTIHKTLLIIGLLSFVSITIAILVSIRIDRTIKNYTDKLVKYKEDKVRQDKLLTQQSKMVSMGEMIGNIAHQWRQPLSVISTASTGMKMQKEFDNLTDESFIKSCDMINNNAQYLSRTIDDFRNFIKGDRNKTIFDLKDDVDSFLHLVNGSIKTHHINIVLDLQENILINGYANELTQCLINIFNNAKDILNEKNIEDKYLFISTYEKGNNAIIKIRDNAGGIPQEILPRIFEPYFTTKHKSQGTGLGLHMTYNLIVDGMKGSIDANNIEFNHNDCDYIGAEFMISLIKE